MLCEFRNRYYHSCGHIRQGETSSLSFWLEEESHLFPKVLLCSAETIEGKEPLLLFAIRSNPRFVETSVAQLLSKGAELCLATKMLGVSYDDHGDTRGGGDEINVVHSMIKAHSSNEVFETVFNAILQHQPAVDKAINFKYKGMSIVMHSLSTVDSSRLPAATLPHRFEMILRLVERYIAVKIQSNPKKKLQQVDLSKELIANFFLAADEQTTVFHYITRYSGGGDDAQRVELCLRMFEFLSRNVVHSWLTDKKLLCATDSHPDGGKSCLQHSEQVSTIVSAAHMPSPSSVRACIENTDSLAPMSTLFESFKKGTQKDDYHYWRRNIHLYREFYGRWPMSGRKIAETSEADDSGSSCVIQ